MVIDSAAPILVVDDFSTVVRIFKTLLKQAGFDHVDGAADGEEALARMKERDYGLVISDWHMAPVNGLDLLRRTRSDEQLSKVPFIMVSAESSPEKMAEAKAEGAAAYLVKPFDAMTLKARIHTALAA